MLKSIWDFIVESYISTQKRFFNFNEMKGESRYIIMITNVNIMQITVKFFMWIQF